MSPRASTRAAHRETSGAKERLLIAAAGVFRECGYRAASLDEILRRSRVAKSNFYYHYSGKLELACETVDLWLYALGLTLLPHLSKAERSGLDRVRDFVAAFESECRDGPVGCPFGMLAAEEDLEEPLRARVQHALDVTEEGVRKALETGVSDGSVRSGVDPATLAVAIVAAVQGGGLLGRALGEPCRISDSVEPVLGLIQGPGPDAPPRQGR